MAGMGISGQDQPDNNAANGQEIIQNADQPQVLLTEDSGSVAVQAHPDNNGTIYIGFSDDVDSITGFPLAAGSGVSMDLDVSEQPLWVVSSTVGDVAAWILTE